MSGRNSNLKNEIDCVSSGPFDHTAPQMLQNEIRTLANQPDEHSVLGRLPNFDSMTWHWNNTEFAGNGIVIPFQQSQNMVSHRCRAEDETACIQHGDIPMVAIREWSRSLPQCLRDLHVYHQHDALERSMEKMETQTRCTKRNGWVYSDSDGQAEWVNIEEGGGILRWVREECRYEEFDRLPVTAVSRKCLKSYQNTRYWITNRDLLD